MFHCMLLQATDTARTYSIFKRVATKLALLVTLTVSKWFGNLDNLNYSSVFLINIFISLYVCIYNEVTYTYIAEIYCGRWDLLHLVLRDAFTRRRWQSESLPPPLALAFSWQIMAVAAKVLLPAAAKPTGLGMQWLLLFLLLVETTTFPGYSSPRCNFEVLPVHVFLQFLSYSPQVFKQSLFLCFFFPCGRKVRKNCSLKRESSGKRQLRQFSWEEKERHLRWKGLFAAFLRPLCGLFAASLRPFWVNVSTSNQERLKVWQRTPSLILLLLLLLLLRLFLLLLFFLFLLLLSLRLQPSCRSTRSAAPTLTSATKSWWISQRHEER